MNHELTIFPDFLLKIFPTNEHQQREAYYKASLEFSASVASLQGSSIRSESPHGTKPYDGTTSARKVENPDRYSQTLTTASLVDNLVRGSHYHDETLCQLLLAARNTKLGDAAKRAVRHAARKRVMQLLAENDLSAVSIGGSDMSTS